MVDVNNTVCIYIAVMTFTYRMFTVFTTFIWKQKF